MKHFFITGLPRSRTNWFSAYFSSLPGVYCAHELMNGCRSRAELGMRLRSLNADYSGNSDSGLMYSNFQQEFMGSPTVIIERDIEDVYFSLGQMFGPRLVEDSSQLDRLKDQQDKLSKLSGLRIPYEEINNRIQEIHEHLVGVPFDQGHAEQFINKNIQVDNLNVDLESYRMWMEG